MSLPLGRVVTTPAALKAVQDAGLNPGDLLDRHANGDWGNTGADDQVANARALIDGERVISFYTLRIGVTVWIVTEADRSLTTLCLPEEC